LLTPGEWQSIPPNTVARQELASAVNNGVLWILGGLSGTTSTPKVEGYNPSTKTWQPGPDLPLALNHEMAATYKGEIVVAGGWVGQGDNIQAATSDQVFVLRGQNWVELPRLKRPRTAGAAAVAGGKLVVFGGQGADGQLVPQTELFDGTKWTDGPNLPTPRDHLAGASDGAFVYAVGGRELSASKNLAAVDRYDAGANKWSKLADLPQPRGDLGAAIVGRRLIAAGGEDATSVFGDVFSYDIDKKAWSGLPPMKTPRHGIAFGAVASSVFALDGAATSKHTAATTISEELPFTRQSSSSSSPTTEAASNSPWKAIPSADTARQEVASTVAGGVVYVMGGLTGKEGTTKVEGFEPASRSWKDEPDLPLPLHHAMAVTFQDNPVVIGGWTAEGDNLNAKTSNRVFMLSGGGWAELPPLNRPRAAGAAAVVGDKIVVVGGQGGDGQLLPQTEVFDGTKWVDARPIPTPRDHLAAVANDRFIFAIGGRKLTPDQNLAVVESFDPATNQWFQWPQMPTARGGLGAAVVGGVIYAVGGETPTEALNIVETFTFNGPLAGGWAPADPMRTPRHGVAVESLGSSLFAIDGGRKPGNADPTKTGEVLNP
jgi:non-specific serine/threonine protein kinase